MLYCYWLNLPDGKGFRGARVLWWQDQRFFLGHRFQTFECSLAQLQCNMNLDDLWILHIPSSSSVLNSFSSLANSERILDQSTFTLHPPDWTRSLVPFTFFCLCVQATLAHRQLRHCLSLVEMDNELNGDELNNLCAVRRMFYYFVSANFHFQQQCHQE